MGRLSPRSIPKSRARSSPPPRRADSLGAGRRRTPVIHPPTYRRVGGLRHGRQKVYEPRARRYEALSGLPRWRTCGATSSSAAVGITLQGDPPGFMVPARPHYPVLQRRGCGEYEFAPRGGERCSCGRAIPLSHGPHVSRLRLLPVVSFARSANHRRSEAMPVFRNDHNGGNSVSFHISLRKYQGETRWW